LDITVLYRNIEPLQPILIPRFVETHFSKNCLLKNQAVAAFIEQLTTEWSIFVKRQMSAAKKILKTTKSSNSRR